MPSIGLFEREAAYGSPEQWGYLLFYTAHGSDNRGDIYHFITHQCQWRYLYLLNELFNNQMPLASPSWLSTKLSNNDMSSSLSLPS